MGSLRSALLSLTALAIAFGFASGAEAQDNTKIVDGGTQFHRLYVLGNGNNDSEDAAFEDDLTDLKNGVEKAGNQANGSTSQTLRKPTIAELQTALNALGTAAGPGDEITLYFSGHGGGTQKYGRQDNTEGGEPDKADEHFRLRTGTSLFDDDLPGMLATAGIPGASETLVLVFDSCYGGGFTGGADDLAESDNVKVIGPRGQCSIDPPGLLGWLRTTISEAVGAKASEGGVLTGDQLKSHLSGYDLGPPIGTEPVKKGKSKCDNCVGVQSLQVQPDTGLPGFTTELSGVNFTPNASVNLELIKPDQTQSTLGSTFSNEQGSFTAQVSIPGPAGSYLVLATDSNDFDDWAPAAVGSVGGILDAPLADADAVAQAADGSGSSFPYAAIAGGAVAAALGLVAGGGWYVRRRWLR